MSHRMHPLSSRSTYGFEVKCLSGWRDKKKRTGKIVALATALAILTCGAGCGASVTGTAGYQPPFLPIIITIDSAGNIALHGQLSAETPVGTFSLEESVSKDLAPVTGTTLLIIEHRQGITVVYSAFRIKSQQIDVALNGSIRLRVTNNQVFVNATRAHVQSIVIRSAVAVGGSPVLDSCLVGTWRDSGQRTSTRWDDGMAIWSQCMAAQATLTTFSRPASTETHGNPLCRFTGVTKDTASERSYAVIARCHSSEPSVAMRCR